MSVPQFTLETVIICPQKHVSIATFCAAEGQWWGVRRSLGIACAVASWLESPVLFGIGLAEFVLLFSAHTPKVCAEIRDHSFLHILRMRHDLKHKGVVAEISSVREP